MAQTRMFEIKCSCKLHKLSKIQHHHPWIILGRQVYLIDESLFKTRQIHHNNYNNNEDVIISPFKRQRYNNNDDDKEDVMISDLPNNILYHILSFLPTKDAVKTSILATNWRYLWTYLSLFDFQMLSMPQILHHRFPSAMSTLRRNITPSLSQLSLQLAKTTLSIPTGISFPSLKTLSLSYATFANNNSLEQFLSRCPLLQDLTLNYCYLFYINKITIAISTLTKLTIHIDYLCLNSHDSDNYLVEIDAVNLLSLTCTSLPTIQFQIVNPPTSILDAHIAFGINTSQFINRRYVPPYSLVLLSGLAHVKSLTLSNGFFQIPVYNSDHLHLLPEFHNLTHLCLGLKICRIRSTQIILEFLQRCPKLEVLVMPLGLATFSGAPESPLNLVPPCFKSSLKILHISNFDKYGIKFAKYLLENARLLVEIRITYSSSLLSKLNDMEDLKNQLVGMGSCAIKFEETTCRHEALCMCLDFN